MRMLKRFLPLIFLLPLIALAGCGGGASDSSGTLVLAVTAPSAAAQPGTATATYTPLGGKSPMGVDISFSTDHPELVALETGSRKVGSAGTAIVTFMTQTPQQTTTVRISASSGGLSTFQIITLTGDPAAPPPTTITPTAAVPTQIQVQPTTPADGKLALKGTGTSVRPENGFVTFKVLDASSQPVAGQVVTFALSPSNNGGAALTSNSMTTQSDGSVTVGVSAGSTQVTVQITATLTSNPALTAIAQFAVTSGPPDQDSFSLSAGTLNSESYNVDGVIVPISVRLADHFNNPPPAGTTVIFTTNAGKVGGSGITDATGNVTVNWESQDPRTADGIFVIMARAVGEESFTDTNGNGLADAGEFTDTGDAYRDDNANDVYDAGLETYFPIVNGAAYSAGDALYNGMYPGAAYTAAPKTKNIFKNIVMVMSTSSANITPSIAGPIAAPVGFHVDISDLHGNTMPKGTTIVVSADNGKLSGTTSFTVANNNGGALRIPVNLTSDGTVSAGGAVIITVTSPGGVVTTSSVPIGGGV